MNVKKIKIAVAVALGVTTLTGCMGQMGVTKALTGLNLKAVDNRYAREGLYLLLSPVYGITAIADLLVFNSIEFWTGKNIITGKSPAVVDMKVGGELIKMNSSLDSSLTGAPVQTNINVQDTTIQQIDENTVEMHVTMTDGTEQMLSGTKVDDKVNFYLDGEFITAVEVNELENYVAATQA